MHLCGAAGRETDYLPWYKNRHKYKETALLAKLFRLYFLGFFGYIFFFLKANYLLR